MAKIIRLEQEPEAGAGTFAFLADSDMIETFALAGLGLLGAVFAILMVRGMFIKDSKPRRKAAAMTTSDYEGVGFGKNRSRR